MKKKQNSSNAPRVTKAQLGDRLSEVFGDTKEMPPYDKVKSFWPSGPWVDFVEELFFNGGSLEGLNPKPGVDVADVRHKLKCWLASFKPSHEHKIAACAWLLSENFEARK